MSRTWLAGLLAGAVVLGTWTAADAQVTPSSPQAYQLQRWYYYPYYYFPHNYWPAMGPRWPEQPNQPYMRPPAYMAYPPFHEPNWRYEMWQPQRFYRGFHFWLDQF
jgi:hypothetical protein